MSSPGQAPAAPVAPEAPAAFDWSATGGLDAANLGVVQNKGWKTPGDMLTSYVNLEKLVGVPPEQIVRLPQGETTPQQWNEAVYDRLGRPKTAAEYKLAVPTGVDPKFAEAASTWFHENGLNGKQAAALNTKYNEFVAQQMAAQQTATTARDTTEAAALKAEWGPKYDDNVALVDNAAKSFGMNADQLNALRSAMGPKAAMQFMANIGAKLGTSDGFVSGDSRTTTFAGGMTAEQAGARMATLRADKSFVERWSKGDAEARAEMTRLNMILHPGMTTL